MKTAGDLLKSKRLTLELTLADVAGKTKLKEDYLLALENSAFNLLPSATFAKGALTNYAKVLHLNPETIVAMFRRDFAENDKGEIIPRGLVNPVVKKTTFIPVNLILSSVAILAFLGFLGFQLLSWASLPRLELVQPEDGETYGEKVTVRGVTEKDSAVLVSGQSVIVDQNGQFTLDLVFPAGTHSVLVEATNRQGKTRLLKRSFTVSK